MQLPDTLTVAMVATVLDLLQTVSVSQIVNSLGTVVMISSVYAVRMPVQSIAILV